MVSSFLAPFPLPFPFPFPVESAHSPVFRKLLGDKFVALHADPRRHKDTQGVPHRLGVVVARGALRRRGQRLFDGRRRGRLAPQRLGARNDVFVQRGVLARRDSIPERIAHDGIDGGRGGRGSSRATRARSLRRRHNFVLLLFF